MYTSTDESQKTKMKKHWAKLVEEHMSLYLHKIKKAWKIMFFMTQYVVKLCFIKQGNHKKKIQGKR